MKKKAEFFVKTATILLVCVAVMGACCQVCKDGECGEDGKDGLQGPQGIPGNAGVKMYIYGSKTSIYDRYSDSNTLTYTIPLEAAALEKSEVYAYFKSEENVKLEINEWYPVAESFLGGDLKALSALSGSNYIVSFFNVNNRGAYPNVVTFGAFKIIVVPIPDENIEAAKSAVSLDWNNYDKVAAYYGFPE